MATVWMDGWGVKVGLTHQETQTLLADVQEGQKAEGIAAVLVGLFAHVLGEVGTILGAVLTMLAALLAFDATQVQNADQGNGVVVTFPWIAMALGWWGLGVAAPAGPAVGNYKLVSVSSGLVLDVPGASSAPGVDIQQYGDTGGANQRWKLTPNAGIYQIASVSSGLVLDVTGGATTSGALIQQYTDQAGSNQRWSFVPVGDGIYKIISQRSGLVLDVIGAATNSGAQIQQYTDTGGANQQWQVVPV